MCPLFFLYLNSFYFTFRTEHLATPTTAPSSAVLTLGQRSLSVLENLMRYETARLASFRKLGWNQLIAEQLALAGFYLIPASGGRSLVCHFLRIMTKLKYHLVSHLALETNKVTKLSTFVIVWPECNLKLFEAKRLVCYR